MTIDKGNKNKYEKELLSKQLESLNIKNEFKYFKITISMMQNEW